MSPNNRSLTDEEILVNNRKRLTADPYKGGIHVSAEHYLWLANEIEKARRDNSRLAAMLNEAHDKWEYALKECAAEKARAERYRHAYAELQASAIPADKA